jgi:hypothetical protein
MKTRWGIVLLAAFVLCVTSSAASAQLAWELGVKGNINGSKLVGDQVGFWLSEGDINLSGTVGDPKLGYGVGAYGRMYTSANFAVQVEVWYIQKGSQGGVWGTLEIDDPNNALRGPVDVNGTLSVNLDYIEVPVLAVFVFQADEDGTVTLTGQLGGYIAFNTRSSVGIEGTARGELVSGGVQVLTIDESTGITSITNKVDLGLIVGGSVEIPAGRVRLIFDGRFEQGLVSVDDSGQNQSIYNQSFVFAFGVGFPL